MPTGLLTIALLIRSNVFMTFAWYAHLRNLSQRPWYIAALVSWGIALFEYLLQVPANRIGFRAMSLGQLKVLQEVITIGVFAPFAIFYMRQPLDWNFAGLASACSAPSSSSSAENAGDAPALDYCRPFALLLQRPGDPRRGAGSRVD
jgi:uncharacterized protein